VLVRSTLFYKLLCTSAITSLDIDARFTGCPCLDVKDNSALLACLFFQTSQSAGQPGSTKPRGIEAKEAKITFGPAR
jgi:hypothetical protein